MRKFIALMVATVICIMSLSACNNKKDDIPDGLQIGYESRDDGYIFYVPENWAVVNGGDVAGAKVSVINNTSVTFTKADMPNEEIPLYFESSLNDFPTVIKDTMNILLRDKECTFGNSGGKAYKYIYTYKYENRDYACMQILLTNNDCFYIFTYTSHGDPDDSGSAYSQYLSSVQLAIDNFKFTEAGEKAQASYEKDADGYNMVSDPTLAGFSLYLPEEYEVIYSSGFVKATINDSANILLSKATQTGVGIMDYLKIRKDDISKFATDFTDVRITLATDVNTESEVYKNWSFDVMPEKDENLCFGNLEKNSILSYEYKYTFNGEVYHVYQVMGVDRYNGYVFTYTALEGEYENHIEKIKNILKKVNF